ncbi:protease propeptide/inhibitor [Earliella scabrosa]|nr:protease propeptide/inhibitor [Earliella scabrosa]
MSGRYIVVFKDHVSQSEIDKHADDVASNGGSVGHRYNTVLKGFSATIPDQYFQKLQSLQGDVIDYIEPDGIVTTQG